MPVYKKNFDREQTIAVQWESDGAGDATIDCGWIQGGTIHQIVSVPGAGVSDLFDVTVSATFQINEDDTIAYSDVLSGDGANLSNSTNGQMKNLSYPFTIPFQSNLVFNLSNAGASKTGTFFIQVWDEQNK